MALPTGPIRYPVFLWMCATEAAQGTLERANGWAWAIGGVLLLGWLVIKNQTQATMPPLEHWGDFAWFTLKMGALSLVISWLVIFVLRMCGAPARLYAQLEASVPPKPKSDLELLLRPDAAYNSFVDAAGERLPATRVFLLRVENGGPIMLRDCQVSFGPLGGQFYYPTSGPFDLRLGEHRDLPVLHIESQKDDPRAMIYMMDPQAWKPLQGGQAWLPAPGDYEIRVLSADTPPAVLVVTLSAKQDQRGRFSDWVLAARQ